MVIVGVVGWVALALSVLGTVYMIAAGLLLRRFLARAVPVPMGDAAVTILKPLHGAEPRLAENLATFLHQRHAGPVQLLCGLHHPDDPARAAIGGLAVDIVVDARTHGGNGKVSNLVNMAGAIRHPVVVLSDSDIAVAPDYLARLLAALGEPGVGAVSCLYHGRGDAGPWSRFCAAGISYQFLPGAAFGVVTGLARPCMGSTVALRRETLDRIGGFAAFADTLADDYAIGEAVRALGLEVRVPPMLVAHVCDETSLGAVWRHELRWAATVRGVAPAAYAASIVSLPLPLALVGAGLAPGPVAAVLVLAALAARLLVFRVVDAGVRDAAVPAWLLPARDLFGFAVFVASFFVRSVDWRRGRLRMAAGGRITAERS